METLLKISAHDNAAIKQYRKLARSRKERTKAGLFVLEGFRLVSDAVKNGAALTQLFWKKCGGNMPVNRRAIQGYWLFLLRQRFL